MGCESVISARDLQESYTRPARGSASAKLRPTNALLSPRAPQPTIVLFTPPMSYPHPAPASSQNFQLIFNNALKMYEKHTKCDLVAHPLAAQLQASNSPSAVLAIIHQQVQGLGQSRMTKWLNPTIAVLYALSETLGQGVGLVRLRTWTRDQFSHIYFPGIFTRTSYLCRSWRPSISTCSFLKSPRAIVTPLSGSYRRS